MTEQNPYQQTLDLPEIVRTDTIDVTDNALAKPLGSKVLALASTDTVSGLSDPSVLETFAQLDKEARKADPTVHETLHFLSKEL